MTKIFFQALAIVAMAGVLGLVLFRGHKPQAISQPDAQTNPPAQQQPAPPLPIIQLPPPGDTVTPLEAALRKGRAENKSVVLFFTTPGCVPCMAMKRDVFSDPSVKKVLDANFVFLTVDSAKDPETISTYKVSSFPTHIVLTSTGQMQKIYVGSLTAVTYPAWLRGEYPEIRRPGIGLLKR